MGEESFPSDHYEKGAQVFRFVCLYYIFKHIYSLGIQTSLFIRGNKTANAQ